MKTETKYMECLALKRWLNEATPTMAMILATMARTSTSMFRQWTTGRRGVSAETAGRMAKASVKLQADNPKAPAPLTRGDLCDACARCEYFNAGVNLEAELKYANPDFYDQNYREPQDADILGSPETEDS